MYKPNLKWFFIGGLSLLSTVLSAEEGEGYDCAFTLSEGTESVRRVLLNEEVYNCFRHDSYADLQVLNADNQPVPFVMSPPPATLENKTTTRDLEFFHEPEPSGYRTQEQIRRIASLTGLRSHSSNDRQWYETNTHYSSIILKLGDLRSDSLTSLSLNVNSRNEPVKATVLVESSNDLRSWRVLSKPHNLYFLNNANEGLNRIVLTSSHTGLVAKYVRLAILSNVPDFEEGLMGVKGEYHQNFKRSQDFQWRSVTLGEVPEQKGVWQFEVPGLIPVSAIRIHNADNIVLYQGRIFYDKHRNPVMAKHKPISGKQKLKEALKGKAKSHNSENQQDRLWRSATSFNHYKLALSDSLVESSLLRVRPIKSETWRIDFSEPKEILPIQLPRVELGWKPSQFKFVAQGAGPFTLNVGSDAISRNTSFPSNAFNQVESFEQVQLSKVDLSKPSDETIEPDVDLTQTWSWQKILLWLVLLSGVGLMVYMAYRLMREMGGGEE